MHVETASEGRTSDARGATLQANVHVIVLTGLQTSSERSFDEGEEEDVGTIQVIRILQHHHLGFVLDIASFSSGPMGAPPYLESENAHEPDPSELSDGDDMAVSWLVGVEANEATGGGDAVGWGRCDVGRDMGENGVAIGEEGWWSEVDGG